MATRYGYVWSGSGGVNPSSSVGIDTSGYTLVTETPNTNNNTSTITVACYYQTWTPYSFGNNGTGTGKITVTVNGVTKTASSSSVKYIDNQVLQEKYLGTLTFENVPHNADGSGSTSFKAVLSKFTTSGGMTMGKSLTRSATITLTKITRSSSIANDTYGQYYKNFGDYVNFTISRPSNETHTLKYWINGTEYVIGNGVETSISYAFPTNLINSFSNNAYITIPVTCYSSNGTTCSTTVYLKVPDSYVPSCSLSVSDVGDVPSSWGIWLKSKSKISGVITSSGSAGSWISSYSSYANGSSYSSSSFITDYLKNSGSQTITSTVTDSRGRQKSDSKTISAVDYWTPTLSNFSVVRCDENGVNKDDGTYGKVICSYSIAPCNDNNTKSLIVKYGDVTKTFTLNSYSGSVEATSSELFSGLSTASNHAFEFYLTDYFNPNGIKYSFTMTPAFTTISYLNGGKGVSIGQVATEEGFNCYMDANFAAGLKKNNVPVPAALNSKSTSDENTYNCNYINSKFSNLFTLIKDLGDNSSYEGGYANIDISLYDIIIIECKNGQTAIMIPAHQGSGIFFDEDWIENADNVIRRKFWKTGNNDIQFDNAYGYGVNGYSSFGTRPTYCIPRYIYGVKF